jgi:hypothetical protein
MRKFVMKYYVLLAKTNGNLRLLLLIAFLADEVYYCSEFGCVLDVLGRRLDIWRLSGRPSNGAGRNAWLLEKQRRSVKEIFKIIWIPFAFTEMEFLFEKIFNPNFCLKLSLFSEHNCKFL